MFEERDHPKEHAGERATAPSCRLLTTSMPWAFFEGGESAHSVPVQHTRPFFLQPPSSLV